jgi:membrane-associated phospholipid phosphatase
MVADDIVEEEVLMKEKNILRLGLILLVVGFLANYASSYILSLLNLDPQPVMDLFLTVVPKVAWMGYLADIVLIVESCLLFIAYRKNRQRIIYAVFMMDAVLIIRSVLILLTPVANSFGPVEYRDLFSFGKYPSGMFPSGHTAYTFLGYLLLKGDRRVKMKWVALGLLVLEIAALMTSHGHYSIDIVGGLMLAYIVYRLGEDVRQR